MNLNLIHIDFGHRGKTTASNSHTGDKNIEEASTCSTSQVDCEWHWVGPDSATEAKNWLNAVTTAIRSLINSLSTFRLWITKPLIGHIPKTIISIICKQNLICNLHVNCMIKFQYSLQISTHWTNLILFQYLVLPWSFEQLPKLYIYLAKFSS